MEVKKFSETTQKKFIAVLFQEGGCDYTIACGTKVINLKATDMEEADSELYDIIMENYNHRDAHLSTATIYEVSDKQVFDLNEIGHRRKIKSFSGRDRKSPL